MAGLFWDAWNPGYGATADIDDGPTRTSKVSVDATVEVPEDAWGPRDPGPAARTPDVVMFVDGVLRNDARGWLVDAEGASHPVLAASFAAGVVRCDLREGRAEVIAAKVQRALLTPAPDTQPVGTEPARYAAHQVKGSEQRDLDGGLRDLLSALEVAVSTETRASTVEDDLLVADGRLRGRQVLPRTIGYIKTHDASYLSATLNRVVTGLRDGQRTPVFALGSLFSWYLRLPGQAGSPWAGIVRVECSGDLTVQAAIELADRSSVTLHRFASSPYKDPRAPQNLIPIAGLERKLRSLLGDPRLLHRTLTRVAP